jgi:hypothetical protein
MYISKLITMGAYSRFWPVSSDHHPYFASYSSGWIGTVSSGAAPLILYKSESTH